MDFTALPTSSTNPQYSCPIGVGPLIGCKPRYGQRSDPHTHVTAIRITASVASMIFGVSRSSNRMSPCPYNTVPRIVVSFLRSVRLVKMGTPHHSTVIPPSTVSARPPTCHPEQSIANDYYTSVKRTRTIEKVRN